MNRSPSPKRFRTTRTITLALVVILLGIIGWLIWSQKSNNNPSNQATQNTQKYTTFDGTVTGINNGCAHDDICTISVNNKPVVTGGGLSSNDQSNTYGVVDADLAIGDKVKVKALNKDSGLTLQGCNDCYITRGSVRGQ